MKLGKSDNLMGKHEQTIANSNWTNKTKAVNNPNNMRAVASLKSMVNEGNSLSEMTNILNGQGFVTSKGGRFQITQVKRLISRYGIVYV